MQIIIITVFLGIWIASRKIRVTNNRFGKIYRPFYKMSIGIYNATFSFFKSIAYYKRLREKLHTLYPDQGKEDIVRQFISYKVMWLLIFVMFGNLVSLTFMIQEGKEETTVHSVHRDSYWGEERMENLQVSVDGIMDRESFQFRIREQEYPKDKIENLLKSKAKQLEKQILKKNESLNNVTTDLDLLNKIPGTEIEVVWEIDNNHVMDFDGSLLLEDVKPEGEMIQLTATLSYKKCLYIEKYYVHIFPPEVSREESVKKKLLQEIIKQERSTNTKNTLKLPDEIDGKKVTFIRITENYAGKILIAVLLVSVLIFLAQDERLNRQLVKRKLQLLADYPEIVSKMTLLLGAGMTIRGAIEKVALDYIKNRKRNKYRKRYVYDELVIICREMQSGISEKTALDHLGKRCQMQCYSKFSTILQQNLKKGSQGLADLLSYEVSEAFETRKSIARKKGEEAGTKLLLPMLFMLVIVLVILLLPAFKSFQI